MFLVSLSIGLIVSGKDCGNDGWPLGDLQYAQVPELLHIVKYLAHFEQLEFSSSCGSAVTKQNHAIKLVERLLPQCRS